MSQLQGLGLLARLGASCSRSLACSGALAQAAEASACAVSCSYNSSMPSSSLAGPIGFSSSWGWSASVRGMATRRNKPPPAPREAWPNYFVSPGNLRDNPGATKQAIRVGRGDSARRGNYSGRGMKGQKARGRGLHMLFDGGQLGFLKYPVSRQRPPYEVLYDQLGLSRVVEFVQLGLLDPTRTITLKDLYDSGCLTGTVKYGVLLYGKARLAVPLDIQVTAADPETVACVAAAGGSVTRVYYEQEGLQAVLHPERYTSRRLPLPLPALRWHPKYDAKFDAIGQIPPAVRQNALPGLPPPPQALLAGAAGAAATVPVAAV